MGRVFNQVISPVSPVNFIIMAFFGSQAGLSKVYEEAIYTEGNWVTVQNLKLNSDCQNIEKIELLELRFSPVNLATNLDVIHFQWKSTSLKNAVGMHYTPLSPVPLSDGSYRLEHNHPPVVYANEGLHRFLSVPFFAEIRTSNDLGNAEIPTLFIYMRFRITRFQSAFMEVAPKFERAILNVPT